MEQILFFAVGNAFPSPLPPTFARGRLRRTRRRGGYFTLAAEFSPTEAERALLWIPRTPRDHPGNRLLEMALAVEAIRERWDRPLELILPYCDQSRANCPANVRAYVRLLDALPVDRIVLFDLHRNDLLSHFRGPALQISSLPIWARHIGSLRPAVDFLVSPDRGRESAVRTLASALNLDVLCLDKRLPFSEASISLPGTHAFLYDDEIVSGKTIISAVQALSRSGTLDIAIGICHGFCSDRTLEAVGNLPGVRSLAIGDLIRRSGVPPCGHLPLAAPLLEMLSRCGPPSPRSLPEPAASPPHPPQKEPGEEFLRPHSRPAP